MTKLHTSGRAATAVVAGTITALVAGLLVAPLSAPAVPPPGAGTVYYNIPQPTPGNVSSEAFEAQSASEFGTAITMTHGNLTDPQVTVLMSSWACQSGRWTTNDCVTTSGATFSHPITLNIYAAGAGTIGSGPGALLMTQTQTFAIPYRPSKDPVHCTGANAGKWYDAASGNCFNGFATPITFNLPGNLAPANVIVSVAYNTTHYGAAPIGEGAACYTSSGGCGYDSLNVALNPSPSVGSYTLPHTWYLESSWSGAYCESPAPNVGQFVLTGCDFGQAAISIQSGVPHYFGLAGGTVVYGLNGVVTSGYTAASALNTTETGHQATNTTLSANVTNLAVAHTVHTSVSTVAIPGGGSVISTAHTGNVSLLGGLIVLNTLDTVATASISGGVATAGVNTQIAKLKIGGAAVPVNSSKNFTINVAGLATVTLNAERITHYATPDLIRADGAAVIVTLLAAHGSYPAGSVIAVNPVTSAIGFAAAPVRLVGGGAFVAKAFATVGGAVNVLAGPVAANGLPPNGTAGQPRTNSTLAVNLSPVLSAGAASTTVRGDTLPGLSYAVNSAKIAGLALLGTAIKAKALSATAFASRDDSGLHLAETTSIVNLKIGTTLIPVTPAPNTVVNIPGLARVVVNEQSNAGGFASVCALDVTLTTAAVGLPAGARIQVACATAYVL